MDRIDSPLIDEFITRFPLDDLFDELPLPAGGYVEDVATAASSPESFTSWIEELESFLMTDESEEAAVGSVLDVSDNLLAELLAESSQDASPGVIGDSTDGDSDSAGGGDQPEKEKAEGVAFGEEDAGDGPSSKKRRRQLRNKDAAARSRERKKMYVKELEMKSKYLEGECRRLGRLLQCFVAENQALRLGLHNGGTYGAGGAKQESAVLLLESLLLGSLLWFLSITCLFSLSPSLTASAGCDGGRDPQTYGLRRPRNEKLRHPLLEPFGTSRRCRASRSRMKSIIPVPRVVE